MGRPIGSQQVETSERLLRVAGRHFARRGFEGAKLAEIAEDAGIRRPSLLYHYPSKQELYSAVIHQAFGDLALALSTSLESKARSFHERFDDALHKFVSFFDERPEVATLILRELVDAQGPGQSLLLAAGVPVLESMERFIRQEGAGYTRKDLPVRQALLEVFSSILVQNAAGPLREPLWGKRDRTKMLARLLFIEVQA